MKITTQNKLLCIASISSSYIQLMISLLIEEPNPKKSIIKGDNWTTSTAMILCIDFILRRSCRGSIAGPVGLRS